MGDDILTIKETAEEMGLYVQTVSDACRTLGITFKPVPRNGNAKGLDGRDRARIRKALNIPAPAHAAATA